MSPRAGFKEQAGDTHHELNVFILLNSVISLTGIYYKEIFRDMHRDLHIIFLIIALFISTKTGKQSKCHANESSQIRYGISI